MEVFFSVTPLCVQFSCPSCGNGFLVATGKQLMSNPPRYEHRCSNGLCGTMSYNNNAYPQLRNVVNAEPLDPQPDFTQVVQKVINS